MEDLAAFTALNHLGSFGKNFVKFKKNKNVIHRLRVGPYGENCDRGLTVGLGQHFKTSITVFHHTDLPADK